MVGSRLRKSPRRLWSAIAVVVALAVFFSGTVVHLTTEAWWYEAIGYSSVFRTLLGWRALAAVGTFAIFGLFLWGNYAFAQRVTRSTPVRLLEATDFAEYSRNLPQYLMPVLVFAISLGAATASASGWQTLLKFFNATPMDRVDPLFERDLSFYIFQLPLYEALQTWLMALFGGALTVAAGVYILKGAFDLRRGWRQAIDGEAKAHLCLLLAVMAFLQAVNFWLERYGLLYSDGGIVSGAGYTDAHARLLALTLLSVVVLVLSVALVALAGRGGFALPASCIAAFVIIYLLVGQVYPWFEQRFVVEPDELNRESPYIQHNIDFTREAYRLDNVQRQSYPANEDLDRADLEQNEATIQNLRLWDYRPLLTTYQQLQEIRPYYGFRDVDIDRYTFDGDYRQVMLSARELTRSPRNAWVSERLKYTHGYGLVMSPVNVVTENGQPELFVSNIPPETTVDLAIARPGIYYGEQTDEHIFTNTTTEEFDYPIGEENAQTIYSGTGGIPMGSWWRRLLYAWELGSYKVAISPYFQSETRIHYDRDISRRVRKLAPFLRLDSNPYLAVVDGRLQWIIEGYTVSDRYPYSKPVSRIEDAEDILVRGSFAQLLGGRFNYVRNSVKAVVDAYDGSVRFYVADKTDPLLIAYRKIFPDLFATEAAPAALRAHFRYPLDLFKIQAQMYLQYHMSDVEVFYNQEDLWRFPKEKYEDTQQNVEPYYIIMRLPGEEEAEFALVMPFTPRQKDNLISWMAARSDGENYGKLRLYEFPKQELVFGPSQIEARIDQNTEISQQFSLWDQRGSSVKRGNLLVIPIDGSLLYVKPIYLSAESAELPELKRVVVANGDRVIMRQTLDAALAAIFGDSTGVASVPADSRRERSEETAVPANLARRARETYDRAQRALQQGDWSEYGRAIDELDTLLEQLEREASAGEASAT